MCQYGISYFAIFQVRAWPAPLRPAQVHKTLILDDPGDPRAELSFASKPTEVLEGGQIGGLNRIARFFVRTQNPAGYSHRRSVMSLEQLRQSLCISFEAAYDQFGISACLHPFLTGNSRSRTGQPVT